MMRKAKKDLPHRVMHSIVFDRVNFVAAIALMALWIPASVLGQEFSGFLDDYSSLKQVSEMEYVDDAIVGDRTLQNYTAIMIDQPEFILAKDSKYSRMKPDDMKLISDTLRLVLVRESSAAIFGWSAPPEPTQFIYAPA